jgi:hypothetical protein
LQGYLNEKIRCIGRSHSLAYFNGCFGRYIDVDVHRYGIRADTDPTGVFGPANGSNNLVGDTYVMTYVLNTSLGTPTNPPVMGAAGGTVLGVADPVTSATLVVNGISQQVPIGGEDTYQTYTFAASDNRNSVAVGTYTPTGDSSGNVWNLTLAAPIFTQLTTSYNYTLQAGDRGSSYVYLGPTYVDASITEVSLSVAGGVPEASTWAMMILGFAGVGLMAYRRNSRSVFSEAR